MIKKIIIFIILFSCSKRDENFNELQKLNKSNCGEVTRLYHKNTTLQEGNPCGDDKDGTPFGDYAILVKNQITNNSKHFCVNSFAVFSRYSLGDTYCDNLDPNGW